MKKDFLVGDVVSITRDKEEILVEITSVNQYGWFGFIKSTNQSIHVPRTVLVISANVEVDEEEYELYSYNGKVSALDNRGFIGCVDIPDLLKSEDFKKYKSLHNNNTEMLLVYDTQGVSGDVFEGPVTFKSFVNTSYSFTVNARFRYKGLTRGSSVVIYLIDEEDYEEEV